MEIQRALKCLEVGMDDPQYKLIIKINDNDSKRGIEGHVMEDVDRGIAYIWFDFTNHRSDWWINFNAMGVPLNRYISNCLIDDRTVVHKGWIEAFQNIVPIIDTAIGLLGDNTKKIIITGHSLGAAMATLTSVYMGINYRELDFETYLFGSPKVGNKDFTTVQYMLCPDTFNIQHGDDIVPLLPYNIFFPVTLCWYRHSGFIQRIGDKRKWFRIFGRFGKDHTWRSYYRALEESL